METAAPTTGTRARILVAEKLAPEGLALLRADHDVDERVGIPREEFLAILPGYDALLVRSQVQVDAEAVAAGKRLTIIGRAGVGVDNVDLAAATAAGIIVVNAPTGNTIAATEHTLALLMSLARHIAAADASMRRGEWKRPQFTGHELRGQTLGIIGLGKIGMAVADRARGLEMDIIGHDPFVTDEAAALHGVRLTSVADILATADAVTVHVPLTAKTRGMIGAAELATMKPGALLVNVARGGVIDESDLAAALHAGTIAGAAIDVFSSEPPAADNPLLSAPHTILTPHLGASTEEAQTRVAVEACEQVIDVLAGRSARYAVNAPLLTPETAQAIAPYLPVARALGQFYARFAPDLSGLTLEVAGELAAHDTSSLVAATLGGLLEGDTEDRITVVNAAAIAKARGIVIAERKTPDAGRYASLVTLSGPATAVGGTIAASEPRIVRLDEHWLDVPVAAHMLVTRHRDRPGTMGTVGRILGESDVNISAMYLARTEARSDAFMILALDDAVPEATAARIRAEEAVLGLWLIDLGVNDATLALVRHGQTTWVAEGRFQGSADPPLSELGERQAAAVATRLAEPHPESSLPLPAGAPRAIWHSPLARAASTASAIRAAAGSDIPLRPEPGLVELAQGVWEGHTLAEVMASWAAELEAWRTDPVHHHAPGGEPLKAGAMRAAVAIRGILRELGSGLREDWAGGTGSRSPVLGYVDTTSGGPADPVEPLSEPWALVVAHDGILRLVLMELLGISLDRYWALPFGLCAVTVVEIRSGRARLRAHNLSDHLPA